MFFQTEVCGIVLDQFLVTPDVPPVVDADGGHPGQLVDGDVGGPHDPSVPRNPTFYKFRSAAQPFLDLYLQVQCFVFVATLATVATALSKLQKKTRIESVTD